MSGLRIAASASLLVLFGMLRAYTTVAVPGLLPPGDMDLSGALLLDEESSLPDPPTKWLDAAWGFRRAIVINNPGSASATSDFQIRVPVPPDPDMAPSLRDIRFTDSDGTTLLYHWKETDAPDDSQAVWVKVPRTPAAAQSTIYMYYGNPNAQDVSNGPGTFLFFDDFEGNLPYPSIFDILKGKRWVKHEDNPILSKSESGWDSYGLRDPMLLVDSHGYLVKEEDQYIMYYRGNEYDINFEEYADHIRRQIGRAVSPDGIHWTKDQECNPVLRLGEPGAWDDAFIGSAWVIKEGDGEYRLYYDGSDAYVSGIGLATSSDGITWTKYDRNPILTVRDWFGDTDPAPVIAILSVLKREQGDYVVFLEAAPPTGAIIGAVSTDGKVFDPLNGGRPLLAGSEYGWDYLQVANPKVIEVSRDRYIMGYNGRGRLQQQLGFAYSTDLVHWEKYRENPVLFLGEPDTWDGGRIENAFIAKSDLGTSTVRMWYFGSPTTDAVRDCAIGYAVSMQDEVAGPLGWWATYGHPDVSARHAHSGSVSVRIDNGEMEYIRRFQNFVGSFSLRFHVFFERGQGRSAVISVIDGAPTALQMKYEDGHLYYQEPASWIDLGEVSVGAWHAIEVSVNAQGNGVGVFVDGAYVGQYRPPQETIRGLTYLEMAGASENGYYVDDVMVRRNSPSEPKVSVGSKVSMAAWLGRGGSGGLDGLDGPPLLLDPVAPNPTSTTSTLRILLPLAGEVRLQILDIAGRRVRTLLNGSAGTEATTITWDGHDDEGRTVPAGIYWALIQSNRGQQTRKLAVLR